MAVLAGVPNSNLIITGKETNLFISCSIVWDSCHSSIRKKVSCCWVFGSLLLLLSNINGIFLNNKRKIKDKMRLKWARNCALKVTGHIQKKRMKNHFSTLKTQKVWVKLPNWKCWHKWLRSLQFYVWNMHLRIFTHVKSSCIYLHLCMYVYTYIFFFSLSI